MIRALNEELGIPLRALAREATAEPTALLNDREIDWNGLPIREMRKRGWIPSEKPEAVRAFLEPFLSSLGTAASPSVLLRQSSHVRARKNSDSLSLLAWSARVAAVAQARTIDAALERSSVDQNVLRDIAHLSVLDTGPKVAIDYLLKIGIVVVIERQLPNTYLDGAMIPTPFGPVIGLTLRHDRLDSFWFTLFHELAHLLLHGESDVGFFDDIESPAIDSRESEADKLAGSLLIPQQEWQKSPASRLRSPQAAEHLARHLRVHPSIVAGRIRREFNDYRVLSHMVGQGTVRTLFEV